MTALPRVSRTISIEPTAHLPSQPAKRPLQLLNRRLANPELRHNDQIQLSRQFVSDPSECFPDQPLDAISSNRRSQTLAYGNTEPDGCFGVSGCVEGHPPIGYPAPIGKHAIKNLLRPNPGAARQSLTLNGGLGHQSDYTSATRIAPHTRGGYGRPQVAPGTADGLPIGDLRWTCVISSS